jgi:CRP-like cAMP-binding protein
MDLTAVFKDYPHVQTKPAGEVIFEQDSKGAEMYVILDGEVELTVNESVVAVLGPGEFLGEMALMDNSTRSAGATAKTECRLASLTKHRFLIMVQKTPFFALHVIRVFTDRLRSMNRRLVELEKQLKSNQ